MTEKTADLSSLSKEELLTLLAAKGVTQAPASAPLQEEQSSQEKLVSQDRCKYKPLKGDAKQCPEPVTTSYGYCKKHSRTVQAKKAKEEFDAANQKPQVEVKVDSVKEVEKENSKHEDEVDDERDLELEKELRKMEEKVMRDEGKKKPVKRKKIISPNKWGRFEDTETHIVFDPVKRCAYGVQDHKTGNVNALSKSHIDICKRNLWSYTVSSEYEDDDETDEEESEEESESEENEDESEEQEDEQEAEEDEESSEAEEDEDDSDDEEADDSGEE